MQQPSTHDKHHPNWGHRWNPYHERDTRTHLLDNTTFKLLLGNECPKDYVSPDLFMTGCLDAPNDTPLGGTSSVRTIGGYDREEYMTLGREWDSLTQYEQASARTAAMLKQILSEIDD